MMPRPSPPDPRAPVFFLLFTGNGVDRAARLASRAQPASRHELLDQACAFRRLLDLQQVAGAGDEGVVVAVLGAERVIGLRGRGRALEVGIGADQLDRPAELAGAAARD